jgi:hypothetical protein
MKEITLNLAGESMTFRYDPAFTQLETRLSDNEWYPVSFVTLACGRILSPGDVLLCIRLKVSPAHN